MENLNKTKLMAYRDTLDQQLAMMPALQESTRSLTPKPLDPKILEEQAQLIELREEKALLKLMEPGDDKATQRLAELKAREADLVQVLQAKSALIDYAALERNKPAPEQTLQFLRNELASALEAEKDGRSAQGKSSQQLRDEIKLINRRQIGQSAAEGIQFGADLIYVKLGEYTGLTPQQAKIVYMAGKNLTKGIRDSKKDAQHAPLHLAKVLVTTCVDLLRSEYKSSDHAQMVAFAILQESLTSALDASIKGQDVHQAVLNGIAKGLVEGATKQTQSEASKALREFPLNPLLKGQTGFDARILGKM